MWLKFVILLNILNLVLSKDYSRFKVVEIFPKNIEEINLLHKLENDDYDFWSLTKIPNSPVQLMVSSQKYTQLESILKNYKIDFHIKHNDVSSLVRNITTKSYPRSGLSRSISFEKYHSFTEINAYLNELAEKFPKRVNVKHLTKSYQGRDINVISITNGDNQNKSKNVIFVDAGIHAREWIAPAGALYIIDQLVNNFEENKHLLENYYWIILPVVNPDGYDYSLNTDPYWRKTRKPYGKHFGVDGNRNFNYHWAETGTDFEPESDIYHGPIAFSEPETRVVRDILYSLKGRCKLYLTMHSFGKYLLYPWGWTDELPNTWMDIDEVAQAGASAIKKATGTTYTVGSSTNVLYPAAGGSDDYALAKGEVPIAITVEMNGKDFHPSVGEIKNFASENWIGIKAMAEKVIKKFP